MTGSKRQLRQGVWELRVSLGRDPATGKYKQLSRTYHGDAKGADEALRALAESELPKTRQASADGYHRGPDEPLGEDGRGFASAHGGEPEGVRQLLAALPLEVGECVVGWSADRMTTSVGRLEAEYAEVEAAVFQVVQLHRLRRRSADGTPAPRTAPRLVWIPREVVERAEPSLGPDCAIHVWTM